MNRRYPPALFIALLNLMMFVAINGLQLITQKPLFYINKWIMTGLDYHDFYQASVRILLGGNPYEVERFVTPPLFAFVNAPLSTLGFGMAHFIFTAFVPITILISYLIVYKAITRGTDENKDERFHLDALLVIFLSYPLYFLFERGNIDGVVLICMCAGLFILDKHPPIGGLLIAVAVHFKVYPILLLIPIFASRRWKPLLWTCGWLFVIFILLIPYWDDYFLLFTNRSNSFQLFENGSLVNTMLFLGRLSSTIFGGADFLWSFAPTYAVILFSLTLTISALADYQFSPHADGRSHTINALLYLPFMVAFPKSVYHYEFIVFIPLIPIVNYLWMDSSRLSRKYAIGLIALGVALSQWQAVAMFVVTENIGAYYLPGIGLLLSMIGIAAYKWQNLQGIARP